MHSISRSFSAQRSVAMNPRQLALLLGFYFYVLNVNAANDAQRIILLASLVQIRALQAQLCLWNQQFVYDFRFYSASRITALAYIGLAPRLV